MGSGFRQRVKRGAAAAPTGSMRKIKGF